jgi:lauroyl/myristoyl acyltransferase
VRPRRVAIRASDLGLAAALAALLPIAWLVPERRWPGLAERLVAACWPRRRREARLSQIKAAFGALDDDAARRTERESCAVWILRQLQLLRCYRPGGWRPVTRIDGRERIEAALQRGTGVILWTAPFRFSDLATKIGMHAGGYALTHLSMPDHGWSSTRFGVRWLNPVWTAVESRYVKERVVIDTDDPKHATERIRSAVRANGIVSITAIRGAARRPAAIRILQARYRLGLGAPMLAHDTGAALLPVFTVRRPDGSFHILIDEPVPIDATLPRPEAALAAVEEMGRRIERQVRLAPGQWNWWDMERISAASERAQGAGAVASRQAPEASA